MPKLKFFPHCTEYPPQYWCYPPTVLMLSPACTDVSPQCTEYPPQCWSYPPTVLMLSPTVLNNLHSTEGIPPQYWRYPPTVLKVSLHSTEYPPQYWCYPPTVLMLSPACTDVIPPLYWTTSTVLKLSPHMYCCYPPTVLKVSLHSTEYPPQYWCYPPQYWCYPPACTDVIPPLYWTTSTVLKLSPHSTEAIPPLYWTTSTVLKLSPHSTEAIPPQYWCYRPDVLNNLQCTEQPPQYWTDVIWGGSKYHVRNVGIVILFFRFWHLLLSYLYPHAFCQLPLVSSLCQGYGTQVFCQGEVSYTQILKFSSMSVKLIDLTICKATDNFIYFELWHFFAGM